MGLARYLADRRDEHPQQIPEEYCDGTLDPYDDDYRVVLFTSDDEPGTPLQW